MSAVPSSIPGAIWVHASTLMLWHRPPVGIVRVEQAYCRWLLCQPSMRVGQVRFCVFDRYAQRFVEVSRDAVASRLGVPALSPTPSTVPVGEDPASARRAPESSASVTRSPQTSTLKALLLRLLPYIPPRWVPVLHGFARRLLARVRPPMPAPFADGDHWLSLGLDWDTLNQRELYRVKLRHRLRVTLICYDVIPALFPQLVVLPPGGFGAYIVDLAWCADNVLCISERTRSDFEDLLRRLGAPVPPTRVIRLGSEVAAGQGATLRAPTNLRHGPGERPFVLFVSTIERRKNHEILYRAWARLRERGVEPYQLVFVGMRGWGVSDLMHDLHLDPRVQGDILILDRVDDCDLAWLYHNCAFTVFPSLYEGWGLPLVESLAWGKFCLASNAASLPEAGGPWAEYLDPWDLPAWVERLAHYMTHPLAIAEREARIAREFVAPRWADTAAEIHRHVVDAGAGSQSEAAP